MMEIKVSTSRALITFSKPLCELSGCIDNIDAGPVERECVIAEETEGCLCEPIEDVVEFVRGRFEVLKVVGVPVVGNFRLEVPGLVLGPRLPVLEKLTLEPALSLPLCSGLPVPVLWVSSP